MLVYIVTSGEYSDYGIDAAFSTEPEAVTFIENDANLQNHIDTRDIEVWEKDEHLKTLNLTPEGKLFVSWEFKDG